MSIWTHVVGCIRVDGVKSMGSHTDHVERILGPQCTYDKWNDESTLPKGSEGGLQYRVIEYDDGLPWVAVPVWGDLRDYDDLDEIAAWFKKTLADIQTMGRSSFMLIRDAVLYVECEDGRSITLKHEKSE